MINTQYGLCGTLLKFGNCPALNTQIGTQTDSLQYRRILLLKPEKGILEVPCKPFWNYVVCTIEHALYAN